MDPATEPPAPGSAVAESARDEEGGRKRRRTAEASSDSVAPPAAGAQIRAEPPDGAAAGEQRPEFSPADRFQGPWDGFIFKTGDRGLGYYADGGGPAGRGGEPAGEGASGPRASPHGMVLKANKPLVKVRARPGDVAGRRGKKSRKELEKPAVKSLYDRELEQYNASSCSDSRQTSRPLVK